MMMRSSRRVNRLLLVVVGVGAACECPMGVTVDCAEKAIRPWSVPFRQIHCELRCCAATVAAYYGWTPRPSRTSDPYEPLLGWRSLGVWADGAVTHEYVFDPSTTRRYETRESLVATFALSSAKAPDVARVYRTALEAAKARQKRGVLLLVSGDRAFPPTNDDGSTGVPPPPPPKGVQVWATNVAEGAPPGVSAMPIGLSAGPSRAWAKTIRSFLDAGLDASANQRERLLLCSGYRADDRRRADMDALRRLGFDNCDATKVPAAAYWDRLLRAKTVFCPRGFGVATFRTYEAILAGAVPVLPRYPRHDDLFTDIPVLYADLLKPHHQLLRQNDTTADDYSENNDIIKASVISSPHDLRLRYDRLRRHRHALDLKRAFAPFWLRTLANRSGSRPMY